MLCTKNCIEAHLSLLQKAPYNAILRVQNYDALFVSVYTRKHTFCSVSFVKEVCCSTKACDACCVQPTVYVSIRSIKCVPICISNCRNMYSIVEYTFVHSSIETMTKRHNVFLRNHRKTLCKTLNKTPLPVAADVPYRSGMYICPRYYARAFFCASYVFAVLS